MEKQNLDTIKNNKVFFIVSNRTKLNNDIYYFTKKELAMNYIFTEQIEYDGEAFTITVYYFEILPYYFQNTEKSFKIFLKYKLNKFEGKIKGILHENRNHFIYDFEFMSSNNFFIESSPHESIRLSKLRQLTIFNEALENLGIVKTNFLYLHLCIDSQRYIIGQNYHFDFYLETLKLSYQQNIIKNLIMNFNLNDIIPDNYFKNNYYELLEQIEKNSANIFTNDDNNEEEKKCYIKFYTLFMYCIMQDDCDKNKIESLLDNENFQIYYSDIISEFEKILNIDIFIKMIKINFISYDFIITNFSKFYSNNLEPIILLINKYIDAISDCCIKENKIINVIFNIKKINNWENLIDEIEKIFKYQLKNKKVLFIFEEEIWKTIKIHWQKKSFNDNNNSNKKNNEDILLDIKDDPNEKIKKLLEEFRKNSINIIFKSVDQKINYSLDCKETDKFNNLMYLLYEKYPDYKKVKNYFMVNGLKINKSYTIKENGIKNDDVIMLNLY